MTAPPAPSRYGTVVWPHRRTTAAPRALLLGALGAGLVGAILLPDSLPGIGAPIVAGVLVVAVWPLLRIRLNRTAIGFGLLAALLVAMCALRSASWVLLLSVALAIPLFSYAIVGGRGWVEVILGGLSWPAAVERMPGWLNRGMQAHRPRRTDQLIAGLRAGALGVGLVLVFGALLASADAVFGALAAQAAPNPSVGRMPARLITFVLVAIAVLAAGYLAGNRPQWRLLVTREPAPARPIEWLVPIVLLDLLFAAFTAVQATVLVAEDREALLRSTGLTYAQYARQGFFQLVVVTLGVLAVIAVAARKLPAGPGRVPALARGLLGLLCLLGLVVVAAALGRIWMYEHAYGLTRLRIWVHAFELWLGLVIVLVLVAGLVRTRQHGSPASRPTAGRRDWLPRLVAGSGAVGMLVLGLVNPDALIADSQVDRYRSNGALDVGYLAGLSPDAVPALDRLPEPLRGCVLSELAERTGLDHDQPWTRWSWGRHRAEQILDARPVPPVSALGLACGYLTEG
ncbi:MAG TPA: DUF4173 domain-containing protein [Actinomycetes bacterium]|nr:DUF4173 domain-containing protein [Actinomycetes bacterium]